MSPRNRELQVVARERGFDWINQLIFTFKTVLVLLIFDSIKKENFNSFKDYL